MAADVVDFLAGALDGDLRPERCAVSIPGNDTSHQEKNP
jgi:hypothetical protein